MNRERPLPPTYLVLGITSMGALHFLFSGPRVVSGPWRLAGLPIAVVGFVVMLWSDAIFKASRTTLKPLRRSDALVVSGPYRVSRHPMYVSFIMMLVGLAVLAGTLMPMLVVPAMVWLFRAHFVVPEERHMEEQFGREYLEYSERVRRWL